MDLDLGDKRALVTGASQGIGLAIAHALSAEGVRVVAGSRNSSAELEQLKRRADVTHVSADLATADGPIALVTAATSHLGGLDILVNNVGGTAPRVGGFMSIEDSVWFETFELNVMSTVRTTRAAIPHLSESDDAAIVNVSSIAREMPFPPLIDYSAAKGALSVLTKHLAREFAPRGIRVNAVSPGLVHTPMWDGIVEAMAHAFGTDNEGALKIVTQMVGGNSEGGHASAEEIATIVTLLASSRANAVAGSDYTIDSGLSSQ